VARYELTFVINTDLEDVGQQPWWPIIGENPMPIEWLEYILVRDMEVDENVLDAPLEPDTINVIDMCYQPEPEKVKPQLELVVNNVEEESEVSSDEETQQ
jgi:hypothetical protein